VANSIEKRGLGIATIETELHLFEVSRKKERELKKVLMRKLLASVCQVYYPEIFAFGCSASAKE
jgi:hypothetical protein